MNLFRSVPYTSIVLLISYILARVASMFDRYIGWFHPVTLPIVLVGIGFLVAGSLLRIWAMETFYQHGLAVLTVSSQPQLIRTGPFRFSRNPLYIASTAMFVGWAFILHSAVAMLLAIVSTIFWHCLIVFHEEPSLQHRFGHKYRQYSLAVPRWLFL